MLEGIEQLISPLLWLGSILLSMALGFLVGPKFDKSYEIASWLGYGLGGFWLIWMVVLSMVFVIYVLYGNIAIYPAIFSGVLFHKNHLQMRRARKTEELIQDIDRIGIPSLEENAQRIAKDPIQSLKTTDEHHKRLLHSFSGANETIIIIAGHSVGFVLSPEFKSILRKSLKRGVMVYIGYHHENISKQEPANSNLVESEATMNKLHKWASQKDWEGRLEVFSCPAHTNMLIKDDKFAIVGEFNWLSENRAQEVKNQSWVIFNQEFVIKERDKFIMGR